MADEENKGFKVVDRRVVKPEESGEAPAQPADVGASEGAEAGASAKPKGGAGEVQGPGWKMREEKKAAPTVDFTTFCLSLASSAMMHLGEVPNLETGKPEQNLPLAKQTIDILSLLQEKTKGNLSEAEDRLLATILYDLQLRYVQANAVPVPR